MLMIFASVYMFGRWDSAEEVEETELPWELAGHGALATGSVHDCKELLRTYVRSSVAMNSSERGYQLLWTEVDLARKEMDNAPSAYEQHEFVSSVVGEMLAANAITLLTSSEKPTVVSPLGVVPKREDFAESRLLPIVSRTVPYTITSFLPEAAGGNIMSRQPCHSFQRQTWPGSTTLPSFTGR
jgi:glyoxylate carboligase